MNNLKAKFKKIIFIFLIYLPVFTVQLYGAESKLIDVRRSFYGTSMRIVFDFDSPFTFSIKENKLERKIVLSFFNAVLNSNFNSKCITLNNVIVDDISFIENGKNNFDAVITLNNEFLSNVVELHSPLRLAIDIKVVLGKLSVEEYFKRGLAYENKGEYDKALQQYRKAISTRPGHPESYFHAGLIRMIRGEYDKALINFKKVPKNSVLGREAVTYISKIIDSNKQEEEVSNKSEFIDNKEKENTHSVELTENVNNDLEVDSSMVSIVKESENDDSITVSQDLIIDDELDSLKIDEMEEVMAFSDSNYLSQAQLDIFQNINNLIKSKTNILFSYWIYLYVIGSVVALIGGFLLTKKLLKKSNKAKKNHSKYLEKIFKRSVEKDINRGRLPKHYPVQDFDRFREKLINTYSKTNGNVDKIKRNKQKVKDIFEEEILQRNSKIDKILSDTILTSDIKKVNISKNNSFTIKDKYRAVYRLYELGWDIEKIAKELHMEIEEIKLSLSVKPESLEKKNNFKEIYELFDRNKNISEIAKELNIGIGEIELSLNMRGNKKVAIVEA